MGNEDIQDSTEIQPEIPKLYQIKIGKYRTNIKGFGEILAFVNMPVSTCESCGIVRWDEHGICDCGRTCWKSLSANILVEKELTESKLKILVEGLFDQNIGFEINEIVPIKKWKPKETKQFKIKSRLDVADVVTVSTGVSSSDSIPASDKLPEEEIS